MLRAAGEDVRRDRSKRCADPDSWGDDRYGTIEAYFAEGLGIDEADQDRLRTGFLEDATD